MTTTYSVYMIDDNVPRQQNFLIILKRAQEMAASQGLPLQLVSGFGDNASDAREYSISAEHLISALCKESAVYVLDWVLLLNAEELTKFSDWIEAESSPEFTKRALAIAREKPFRALNDEDRRTATRLIYLCAAKDAPRMLTSAQGRAWELAEIHDAGLIQVHDKPSLPEYTFDLDKDEESINTWAKRVLALTVDELGLLEGQTQGWFASDPVLTG